MLDRRRRRTRSLLGDALYELIGERPYDLITVNDIVERADVARSSFYAHFRDKDDLMISGFLDISADTEGRLFDPRPEPGHRFPSFGRHVFSGAFEHRVVSLALLSPAEPTVAAQHLRNLVVGQVRDWFRTLHPDATQADDLELGTQFVSSALLGVLVWWVRAGFPIEPGEMTRRFDLQVENGLATLA